MSLECDIYSARGPGHYIDPLCFFPPHCDVLSSRTLLVIPSDLLLGAVSQFITHNVFHANLITPYKETAIHRPNYSQLPPDLVNGEEEFEVEQILNMKQMGRGHKMHCLVKWKWYTDSEKVCHNMTSQMFTAFCLDHKVPGYDLYGENVAIGTKNKFPKVGDVISSIEVCRDLILGWGCDIFNLLFSKIILATIWVQQQVK